MYFSSRWPNLQLAFIAFRKRSFCFKKQEKQVDTLKNKKVCEEWGQRSCFKGSDTVKAAKKQRRFILAWLPCCDENDVVWVLNWVGFRCHATLKIFNILTTIHLCSVRIDEPFYGFGPSFWVSHPRFKSGVVSLQPPQT